MSTEIKNTNTSADPTYGKIIGVSGGLYKIQTKDGETVFCRAKGAFRHSGLTPLVGDNVRLRFDGVTVKGDESGGGVVIEEVLERKNALIRPPMANLDCMFVSMAAASPAPILPTVDKLVAIAEHNGIEPFIVIEKCELDREKTAEIRNIYETGGFKVFAVSCVTGEGVDELRDFIYSELIDKTTAFSGASGVGKSTLMNMLFPILSLETGNISRKIERGKHTTRSVELYSLENNGKTVYIADTPGFSMLDFKNFDFFSKDDLPYTFREFVPLIGQCKYTKCSHTKEEGCAILEEIKKGNISKSRHDSFLEIYSILKDKKEWDK